MFLTFFNMPSGRKLCFLVWDVTIGKKREKKIKTINTGYGKKWFLRDF